MCTRSVTKLAVLLIVPIWLGCNTSSDNLPGNLIKEKIIIVDDSTCSVISFYPKITWVKEDSAISKTNRILMNVNDMERFKDCKKFTNENEINNRAEIIGDYNLLYASDSLVYLEFYVASKGFPKILYRSVFLDFKTMRVKEPRRVYPNIDRSVLLKYVNNFIDSSGIVINRLAYAPNSNYMIMYGRDKYNLILYVGNEGEYGGYYKIKVPLNELQLK